MAQRINKNEATAAFRRIYIHLVDATDGITPETGEAGGQPQISINGAAWVNSAGLLVAIGNGRYYFEPSQVQVNQTHLTTIESRYKSANTAEALGSMVQIIDDVPVSFIAALVESQRGAHTWQGNHYYVDPVNGTTFALGADGSRSNPFNSLQDCIDNAVTDSNHDVVFLIAGNPAGVTTLTEDVTIDKRYTFIRGPGRDFIMTRADAGNTVSITADGVELSGVQINTAGIGTGKGVDISGADFVKVHNCWINDTRGDAINISNSDNIQILDNHLQFSGQSGAGDGIVIDSAGGSGQFSIVLNNVIRHVAGSGIKLSGANAQHAVIKDNIIQDCDDYGIDIGGGVVEAYLIDNKLALNDLGDIRDNGSNTSFHNNKTTEDEVWDTILTGATHNTPNSAGRRLRNISSAVITDGTCPSAPLLANEIIFNGDAFITDGAYDPAIVSIVNGTGKGQTRLILKYTGATKTARVGRTWKTIPDNTSEYIIVADAGREHVHEDAASGGTINTITLGSLGSDIDEIYKGQIIFIRSGTGEDQANKVRSYDGTTRIAIMEEDWVVIPDTTSAYAMLPTGSFSSVNVTQINGSPATGAIIEGVLTDRRVVVDGGTIEIVQGDNTLFTLTTTRDLTGKKAYFSMTTVRNGTPDLFDEEATITQVSPGVIESRIDATASASVSEVWGEFEIRETDESVPETLAQFKIVIIPQVRA